MPEEKHKIEPIQKKCLEIKRKQLTSIEVIEDFFGYHLARDSEEENKNPDIKTLLLSRSFFGDSNEENYGYRIKIENGNISFADLPDNSRTHFREFNRLKAYHVDSLLDKLRGITISALGGTITRYR